MTGRSVKIKNIHAYEKYRNYCQIILVLLVVLAFVSAAAVYKVGEKGSYRVEEFNDGWFYYNSNNDKVYVELPGVIDSGNPCLEIYHDSAAFSYEFDTILLQGAAPYNLKIYQGNKCLYEYSQDGIIGSEQAKDNIYSVATVNVKLSDKFKMIFYDEDGYYVINDIYIGSSVNILLKEILDCLPIILISILMLIMAAGLTAAFLILYTRGLPEIRFLHISAFLMLSGVFFLVNMSLARTQIESHQMICLVSVFIFGILPVPLLQYIRHAGILTQKKTMDFFCVAFYASDIIRGFLQVSNIASFGQTLPYLHVLMAVAIAVTMWCMYRSYVTGESNKGVKAIVSVSVLAVAAVAALVVFSIVEKSSGIGVFMVGVIVFAIMLTTDVVYDVTEKVNMSTEIRMYKKLSREDPLTGIGNRRAYTETMENLYSDIGKYDTAVLVFADMNNLKMINDIHGHSVGDNIIIKLASIMKTVFGDYCFRFGGDEFCGILLETKDCDGSGVVEKVKTLFSQASEEFDVDLSVSCGWSPVKDESGAIIPMNRCEQRADAMMYSEKVLFHSVNK